MARLRRILSLALAALAALLCLFDAIVFFAWLSDAPSGALWPMPGFALVWVGLLGAAGFVTILLNPRRGGTPLQALPWAISGALLSLAVLGAWSIGPPLWAAALALAGAAGLAQWREVRPGATALALLLGALANTALFLGLLLLHGARP